MDNSIYIHAKMDDNFIDGRITIDFDINDNKTFIIYYILINDICRTMDIKYELISDRKQETIYNDYVIYFEDEKQKIKFLDMIDDISLNMVNVENEF